MSAVQVSAVMETFPGAAFLKVSDLFACPANSFPHLNICLKFLQPFGCLVVQTDAHVPCTWQLRLQGPGAHGDKAIPEGCIISDGERLFRNVRFVSKQGAEHQTWLSMAMNFVTAWSKFSFVNSFATSNLTNSLSSVVCEEPAFSATIFFHNG